MTFQERKRKKWLNYDVTVLSYSVSGVSPESFGWEKEESKLPSLILDFNHLDTLRILQKCWVFSFSYGIWMAKSVSDLNLLTSVFYFTIKPTILDVGLGREKSHSDFWAEETFEFICPVFQEDVNVHQEARDHRTKRRCGMRKWNYNLMFRALLWEQSPHLLVPPEQSLVWNQALFSRLWWLSNCSGQWIYLPLIPKLQSISDGTLVLRSSWEPLEDTAGYNMGIFFFAYNAPSPSLTSAKPLCQGILSVSVGFFDLPTCEGFFVSTWESQSSDECSNSAWSLVGQLWWSLKLQWVFNLT